MSAGAPVLCRLLSHSFQIGLLETGQIRDVPRTCLGNNRWCCPIETQELGEIHLHPDRRADDPDEARVAALPLREKALEAQDQVDDERSPYLPFDRVRVRAVEALELQRLLQFLEEEFNRPPALVEVRYGSRRPCEVVGDEDHFPQHAFDLDDGLHEPDLGRVFPLCVSLREEDPFVRENPDLSLVLRNRRDDRVLEVMLHATHEGDVPFVESVVEGKAVIPSVCDHDIAVLQVCAHFVGFSDVCFLCGVDDDEVRANGGLLFDEAAKKMTLTDKCVGCGRCLGACNFDAISFAYDQAISVLNAKMAEYTKAVVDGRPSFHMSLVIDVSPFCDCHGENDAPILPNIGMFASFDPVALDQACADACLKAEPIRNSLLGDNLAKCECDHHDHFKNTTPESDWESQLVHGEKIGLGTRSYELITIK